MRTVTIPGIVNEKGIETQRAEIIVPAAPLVIPDKYTVKALIARFNQSNAQLAIRTVRTRHTAFAIYGGEPSPYESDPQSATSRKRTTSKVDENNNKSKKKKQFALTGDSTVLTSFLTSVDQAGVQTSKRKRRRSTGSIPATPTRDTRSSIPYEPVREQATASYPSHPANQSSDTVDEPSASLDQLHRFQHSQTQGSLFLHASFVDSRPCVRRTRLQQSNIGSGDSVSPVLAYGKCHVTLSTPSGPRKFTLLNIVALVPNYVTSLVALSRFSGGDVHFELGRLVLYRLSHKDSTVWCNVFENGSHYALIGRQEEFTEPSGTVKYSSEPS
ncbi:hypothetical protein CC80DRAFT_509128 [Byssothecium circinans]|uniref:Uncharacterized protein n=1 Tax=Byssothecium circinans TaxID=147558 RepID=A0A6A5TFZ3_9PLEO|nr:hypothetical protein CC80DRAFT_509128 [Byssothecium circinans]